MVYNIGMKKQKYESFKIDTDLMALIRKYANRDRRSIKTTIDMVLRERFQRGKTDSR